ncbi:UNVERIFIED_CONTAM: hypothetical protein GTU68_003387 [Idotea baltica]|nr:hypothetical protein [Idotea baltica]
MSRKVQLALSEKHYTAAEVERNTYALWEEHKVFTHDPDSKKPPYCIVIPPPNVTGRLHMGHALNNSVQDALIRYKRMDGYDVLWVPGTDHAGISTQSVVKKHLDAEGINYLDLGREAVIERIWKWKDKYGDQILNQLRRLGCSCDWSMTRFTMDEGLSAAVRTAFVHYYDRGLIYRGKYIVNWCPIDRTALSDDEVVTADGGEAGHLWHFRYPLADGSGNVVIATTRPETMLGDSAVAVNPKDERYQHLIGKKIALPLCNREIPIIADDYVDRTFGSGCLKVTPAHDPNDFQIGLRHSLESINVMNEDATIGDQAPEAYHGIDRFECRKLVVQELEQLGLVEKIEERMTPVGRAQRSKAIIEYRLSDQWFVKMEPLAKKALAASDSGGLAIHPERWDKVYRSWLENIRDWCISRQIWWGHRIPAWYNKSSGEILVAIDEPEQVRENPEDWYQDEDVLDTWFSSALWPFSTLGWPEQTADLERYYPTSVLSTAKDIIYFWVARMVMGGLELVEDMPFKEVYFHPVICDARGETMSKSKGNGIDPLHVIDGVGADALRVTLLSLNSHAQQVQLSLNKFEETGKRFTDKLWNAARFVLANIEDSPSQTPKQDKLKLEDKWILGKLDKTTATVRESFAAYTFSQGLSELLRFFWDDVCDWYVELAKERLKDAEPEEKALVQSVLAELLGSTLRLLHPYAPYITEELWDEESSPNELCCLAGFPTDKSRFTSEQNSQFENLQEIIRSFRHMRSSAGVGFAAGIDAAVLIRDKSLESLIKTEQSVLKRSANLASLNIVDAGPEGYATSVLDGMELFADLEAHIDVSAEIERAEAALRKVEKEMSKATLKLENPKFMANAPDAVKEQQAKVVKESQIQLEKLTRVIADLSARKGQ